MQKTQSGRITAADNFLLQYAKALIVYAKSNLKFAAALAYQVQIRDWNEVVSIKQESPSVYLIPDDEHKAVLSAYWLLNTLDNQPITSQTRGTLAIWAQNYESPKDLLFGFVGLAVIGPTLGLINSKKKKRSHMKIIIENEFNQSLSKTQTAALSQKLSMGILAQELRLVGGNAYSLHPDTAAWCLEESKTKIYLVDQAELATLKTACINENLSHQADIVNGAVRAISISPSVNDEFIAEFSTESPG